VVTRINGMDATQSNLAAIKRVLGETSNPVVTFTRRRSVGQLVLPIVMLSIVFQPLVRRWFTCLFVHVFMFAKFLNGPQPDIVPGSPVVHIVDSVPRLL
jgi:hypothetical protein